MGLIIRQSIKSSLSFYIGVGLGAINTLFVTTYFLTPDELAVSRILVENGLIFAAFAHLGSPYISDRFFTYFNDVDQKHHGFMSFLLLFPLLGFSVFVLGFYSSYDWIESYFIQKSASVTPYLWLSVPITLAWVYILVLEAFIRANGRTAVPTFLKEVVYRLGQMCLVVILGLGWIDFKLFLYLFVALMFLLVVSMIVYLMVLGKWFFSFQFDAWDKAIVKKMVSFGIIIIFGGIGANLILFIDRNIIANQIGTTAVAIFTVAAYIATVIEIPSKAIRSISGPIISDAMRKKDMTKVTMLYQRSASTMLFVGGLMFVLIVINLDPLLSILPRSEVYSGGKWIVIIIGFAKWIDMSLGLNIELITYSKYFRVNTFLILIMAVIAIQTNLWLIPSYGIIGAALATGLITVSSSLFRLCYVAFRFSITPFVRIDLFTLFSIFCVGLLGFIIPSLTGSLLQVLIGIAIKSIVMILLAIGMCWKFNIIPELTLLLESWYAKVRG